MTLLITKGHYPDTVSVFEYFIGLVKEEKKIGIANVTTAFALSAKQKSDIEKRLLETTQYETFEMNYDVDESLIGGMESKREKSGSGRSQSLIQLSTK